MRSTFGRAAARVGRRMARPVDDNAALSGRRCGAVSPRSDVGYRGSMQHDIDVVDDRSECGPDALHLRLADHRSESGLEALSLDA